jgi:hypothetical protein
VKTTDERPLLFDEGCRNAAYLRMAGCGPSWPVGNQIHIPLRRSQQRRKRSAIVSFQAQATKLEPGHNSLPKRAHPARQAHQPLGPGTTSRPQAVSSDGRHRDRAESTPVSRRSQHPECRSNASPVGQRVPSAERGVAVAGGQEYPDMQRPQVSRPRTRLTLSRSQEPETHASTASTAPGSIPNAPRRKAPLCSRNPTPLDCSHLVSAHPP